MSSNDVVTSVASPLSGIFYRKSDPDHPPYVEIGSKVKKAQVLALLETMKVFTKVKAPRDGEIVEILPEDGSTIDKGQILFRLRG